MNLSYGHNVYVFKVPLVIHKWTNGTDISWKFVFYT